MTKQYINQYKTYLIVLLATMILCTIFLLSVDFNNKSEQTYEMTDHKIHQHNQQGTTQNYKDKQNSEQNDQSVFALVN